MALVSLLLAATAHAAGPSNLVLPKHRLQADELAVIVNDADPLSVQIGNYYLQARHIPPQNLLHVRFDPGRSNMPASEFTPLRAAVVRDTPAHIQAYAITWIAPYRVDCMSFTSALTFGFDRGWCSSKRCAPTQHSPYYKYVGSTPMTSLGIRPSIAVAATSFDDARALIDRGIAADGTSPPGTAYLVSTTDRARNVRAAGYPAIENLLQARIKVERVATNALRDRDDVLFYFTGVKQVAGLETLGFVPGAIADHLTSTGGQLSDSRQMSALRWLQAGATGSYGTVVEPCNLVGKFPNPGKLIDMYTRGRTLIEAYWRSVQQPGEGIFIGEPLAAPFDVLQVTMKDGWLHLSTPVLLPGRYTLQHAESADGPWHQVARFDVDWQANDFMLPHAGAGNYRIQRAKREPPSGEDGESAGP